MVKVGAVVVLYNPNFDVTKKTLSSLASQVDQICVVDNSPSDHSEVLSGYESVEYKPLLKNIGIAAAQNIGIRYFIDLGYDFVLFADQDSIASEKVVDKLLENHQALKEASIKVGAVGTRAINRQTGLPYVEKSNEIRIIDKRVLSNTSNITECYSIMSSISLIPCKVFNIVGGFDESLFIDAVDYEWCWRAWNKCGMRSFVDLSVAIEHQLGSPGKFLWRDISVSSPMRLYYQFRNCIWLSKVSYTPTFWKLKVLRKYICKFLVYPIFFRPRISYLKSAIRGIIDGLFGHMS